MIIILPIVCAKKINDNFVLSYLLEKLNIKNVNYIFIPYYDNNYNSDLEKYLINTYPHIIFKFFCIKDKSTIISVIINYLQDLQDLQDLPFIYLDSDILYNFDIITTWNKENCIFIVKGLSKNENNLCKLFENNNYSCIGAYGFKSLFQFIKVINTAPDITIYESIKLMLNEKINFTNIEILNKDYFSFNTEEQIEEYLNPYIFDLDGTLVDTDDIYTIVWNEIMKKYNIIIDNNFFRHYIQGKNDILFLKEFFPNISDTEIQEISIIKDYLFIKYLKLSDKDILINGAKEFIEKNKNRRMGVVTSSNKKSAECILKYTKICDYMQFLIASEDCSNHKPHKEPYEKALNILKCESKNCTIFEDSVSGYMSAKYFNDIKICIILNNNTQEFITNLSEYKISNYDEFNINNLQYTKHTCITELIKYSLKYLFIKDVELNNIDIKTGYICDIQSIKLIFNDISENIILKIENTDNNLSKIARNINLYNNEILFYDKISKIINIKVPKYYLNIDIDNKSGILLEDLNKYNGSFNIDLNKNIDLILGIIKNIINMHNRFYFKTNNEIIGDMQNVIKINDILYYEKLINLRFNSFIKNNNALFTSKDIETLYFIYNNYNKLLNYAGTFPLNFCHGDLKSPNIFYKKTNNEITPIFLDWQYIHLNKGISDIVFLLVESTDFNEELNDIAIKYYYKKSNNYINLNDLMFDFKISLCIFPFFVMVWFGSENREYILDKVFPIRFIKNTLKFYNKYLDNDFFNLI